MKNYLMIVFSIFMMICMGTINAADFIEYGKCAYPIPTDHSVDQKTPSTGKPMPPMGAFKWCVRRRGGEATEALKDLTTRVLYTTEGNFGFNPLFYNMLKNPKLGSDYSFTFFNKRENNQSVMIKRIQNDGRPESLFSMYIRNQQTNYQLVQSEACNVHTKQIIDNEEEKLFCEKWLRMNDMIPPPILPPKDTSIPAPISVTSPAEGSTSPTPTKADTNSPKY